jgi:hypothetical protein
VRRGPAAPGAEIPEAELKYLLIHCVPESFGGHEDLDPATESKLASWLEEMTARGLLLDGARLRSIADATSVRVRDAEVLIADGPFAETKELIGGYDVLDCASIDEAVEIAARHPTAAFGVIEVRPFMTG